LTEKALGGEIFPSQNVMHAITNQVISEEKKLNQSYGTAISRLMFYYLKLAKKIDPDFLKYLMG